MKPRYIFQFGYRRAITETKLKDVEGYSGQMKSYVEFTETIVAENIQQALEHWKLDLMDEGVEFIHIVRGEPVLSVLPK